MKRLALIALIMVFANVGCRKSTDKAPGEAVKPAAAAAFSNTAPVQAPAQGAAPTVENSQAGGSDGSPTAENEQDDAKYLQPTQKIAVLDASTEKYFTIQTDSIVTRAGGTNYPSVIISPAKGRRWNSDFPATARVINAGGLAPETSVFDSQAFIERHGKVRLIVPIATTSTGKFTVEMALTFSICEGDDCETFKDVKVPINFTVTP